MSSVIGPEGGGDVRPVTPNLELALGAAAAAAAMENREHTEMGAFSLSAEIPVTFEDVGGHTELKGELREIGAFFGILDSFTADQAPPTSEEIQELIDYWQVKLPAGILLYGEPGWGKTMLIEAFAHYIHANLWKITDKTIDAKELKRLFDIAEHLGRTVVLFDELADLLLRPDPDPLVGVFKDRAPQLSTRNPQVMLASATNALPSQAAVYRSGRFDMVRYVAPAKTQREHEAIWTAQLARQRRILAANPRPFANDANAESLSYITDERKMTGADIDTAFRMLRLSRLAQRSKKPITYAEIEDKLQRIKNQGGKG